MPLLPLPHCLTASEFAASLVERCWSVDVAAVGAAVSEAAQTAAYLESTVASLHISPQQVRRAACCCCAGAWAGG
jgi:hypothetical protein